MTIAQLKTRGLILLLVLSTAVIAGHTPLTARAEEHGVSVKLAYMYGYSNAGPTNVYGSARLWPSEGVAVLDAHNMPRQENGDTYVSWIVNTTTGASLRLGAFNADDAGNVSQDITFNNAPPQGANALLVTVQHSGDPLNAPAAKRSLAGYFPPLNVALPPVAAPSHARPTTATRPRPATGTRVKPARDTGTGTGHASAAPHTSARQPTAAPPVVIVLPTTGGGPPAARLHAHGHGCHSTRHNKGAGLRLKSHGKPRRLKSLGL